MASVLPWEPVVEEDGFDSILVPLVLLFFLGGTRLPRFLVGITI